MRLEKSCFLGVVLICLSCNNDGKNSTSQKTITDKVIVADAMDAAMLEEAFIDSVSIGRKKLNKLEVLKYRNDSVYVVIRFYAEHTGKWLLKNEFQFEKDGLSECDTRISDFNNDGLNDMTYVSAVAPRGAMKSGACSFMMTI
ncbi:MAG: hypothetical protein IT258_10735 [Saprospiraceae bacterium]|nr:hypothetical protein [Saprospiraceae bacterium]